MRVINLKFKIILAVIVVFILGFTLVWFVKNSGSKNVINEDSEVVKNDDEINTVQISEREMVQVRFSWEVQGIKYNDALNITKEQYEKLTPEDVERMKQERFDNWVKTVNNQSDQKK